jgi:hypothetical protein
LVWNFNQNLSFIFCTLLTTSIWFGILLTLLTTSIWFGILLTADVRFGTLISSYTFWTYILFITLFTVVRSMDLGRFEAILVRDTGNQHVLVTKLTGFVFNLLKMSVLKMKKKTGSPLPRNSDSPCMLQMGGSKNMTMVSVAHPKVCRLGITRIKLNYMVFRLGFHWPRCF